MNYVVCLKWGEKYGSEYVNTLSRMVSRNLTIDYEFVCLTDNSENIDRDINIINLPSYHDVKGWWYKPLVFDPKLGLSGTILFLDLDLIIFNNIDKLFEYKTGSFCIIRDFNRYIIKNYNKFNSSVFRFEAGQYAHIYENFIKSPSKVTSKFLGDQDWIRDQVPSNFNYWPDEWIQSYKWEMRGRPAMDNAPKGQRNFIKPGEPVIQPDTSIAVFHGDPNPHNCIDQWVSKNWY